MEDGNAGPSTPPEISRVIGVCTESINNVNELIPEDLVPKPLQSVFLASSRMSEANNYAFTPHKSKHGDLSELGGVVHVNVADLNEKGITELNINQKKKGDYINCCGKKVPKKTGRFILAALGTIIAFSIFIGRAIDKKMSFSDIIGEVLTIGLALITPSWLEGVWS